MKNIPTNEQLQTPRTPSALRAFVVKEFDSIGQDELSTHAARLWRGPAKEFLREVLPISHFAQIKWPHDEVLIQPRLGNQGFDALVLSRDGNMSGTIEVSWAVDGQAHKEEMEALNQIGVTPIQTYDDEGRAAAVERTLAAARGKTLKDYRGGILLIVFDVLPMFWVEAKKDWDIITHMKSQLTEMRFLASEVFLLLIPPDYVISKNREALLKVG